MSICNANHEEIVYEGHSCPLCGAEDEKKMLEEQVEILTQQIEEYEKPN